MSSGSSIAAEPPVAAAPPPADGGAGRWRKYALAAGFLAPAAVFLLGVWVVYPTVSTIVRSFFDRAGDEFVGLRQLPGDLHERHARSRRSRTTCSGSLVVPAFVTAIGLVFAVLTERVRWSVAFKTVVFMPMAISLFAAGVIWRDDGPEGSRHRRRQRGDPAWSRTTSPRRACSPTAQPVDRRRSTARQNGGLDAGDAGRAGRHRRCSA